MSKVSIERITKIVRLIRRHGAVPMATFLAELEVSHASVKRDLDFLRDRLGCPLDWDRSQRGWVIRDELADGGRFELPGVWFNSSEVFALLTMLHLVEGVQPGLLDEHVGPLKSRFRSLLAEGTKSAKPIERKLKLIHFAPRKVESKHFQLIAGALLDGKRLHLRYLNRDRKEHTERTISPNSWCTTARTGCWTRGATPAMPSGLLHWKPLPTSALWMSPRRKSVRMRCRSTSVAATASLPAKRPTAHA